MILVSVISILAGTLFDKPMTNPQIQAASTLMATMLLLYGTYRAGWIDKTGITRSGTLLSWMAAILVIIYVLFVNFYAFFGEFTIRVEALISQDAVPILLRGLRVGFVEEVVFRGIILGWLVSVWGKSKRGLAAAIAVQAILFGIPLMVLMAESVVWFGVWLVRRPAVRDWLRRRRDGGS